MNENINTGHDCYIKNRNIIELTGVKEVISFDEKSVDLITSLGRLSVRGENIKIESFNTETSDMEIKGKFDAIIYLNDSSKKESFISRLFK